MDASVISLRKAGEELGMDPKIIKGAAMALRLNIRATGTALLIGREDFEFLRRRLEPRPCDTPASRPL